MHLTLINVVGINFARTSTFVQRSCLQLAQQDGGRDDVVIVFGVDPVRGQDGGKLHHVEQKLESFEVIQIIRDPLVGRRGEGKVSPKIT